MTSQSGPNIPTTCVVGAGPSGLAMARALLTKGLPVEVFERNDRIGGIWDPSNEGTPIYESAHFISSKTRTSLLLGSAKAMAEGFPSLN